MLPPSSGMMETAWSSEMPISYHITRHHNPEDCNFNEECPTIQSFKLKTFHLISPHKA